MLIARLEDERDERDDGEQHAEQRVGDQRAGPDPRHDAEELTRLHAIKYAARALSNASPARGILGRSSLGAGRSTSVSTDTGMAAADRGVGACGPPPSQE
ncbi:hypothetical protein GCM10009658_23680 [Planotetraspora silvatica]